MSRAVVLAAAVAAVLCAMTAPPPGRAEPSVIYRCTAGDGAVTFQNGEACPAGHQQQRRVIEIAAPMPEFVAPGRPDPAPAVPLISALPVLPVQEAVDAGPATPPPPLFTCRVHDGSTYWREDDTPPARCVPLQTVGIGGLPGLGAGEACERHEDTCTAVPDDDLCRAWDNRVREAEFRWRFVEGRGRETARLEYERLFTALQASTCGRVDPGTAPAS